MRTKYGCYPEYHTSLDNPSLISPEGLGGAYEGLKKCLTLLEQNYFYRATQLCEPQLGKRGLYPTLSTKESGRTIRTMMNILAYADGQHDLVGIAERLDLPAEECMPIIARFLEEGLLERLEERPPAA